MRRVAAAASCFAAVAAWESPCPSGTVPFPAGKPGLKPQCVDVAQATVDATSWLRMNLPPFDVPNAPSYFNGGIVGPTVRLSLSARQKYSWAAEVPLSVWHDGVLPYASVNEARTNWRELLVQHVPALVQNATSIRTAATAINRGVWAALGSVTGIPAIKFKSEQTPLIYDPLSTILFGYASCTGISLLYVDAMRTVGVPARLAGTPAWHGDPSNGNHNWVEVWLGEEEGWRFVEGMPAGGGETFSNPCDKWFCNAAHFGDGKTQVFATSFDRSGNTSYPMAWEPASTDVAGVNRTDYYFSVCSKC